MSDEQQKDAPTVEVSLERLREMNEDRLQTQNEYRKAIAVMKKLRKENLELRAKVLELEHRLERMKEQLAQWEPFMEDPTPTR